MNQNNQSYLGPRNVSVDPEMIRLMHQNLHNHQIACIKQNILVAMNFDDAAVALGLAQEWRRLTTTGAANLASALQESSDSSIDVQAFQRGCHRLSQVERQYMEQPRPEWHTFKRPAEPNCSPTHHAKNSIAQDQIVHPQPRRNLRDLQQCLPRIFTTGRGVDPHYWASRETQHIPPQLPVRPNHPRPDAAQNHRNHNASVSYFGTDSAATYHTLRSVTDTAGSFDSCETLECDSIDSIPRTSPPPSSIWNDIGIDAEETQSHKQVRLQSTLEPTLTLSSAPASPAASPAESLSSDYYSVLQDIADILAGLEDDAEDKVQEHDIPSDDSLGIFQIHDAGHTPFLSASSSPKNFPSSTVHPSPSTASPSQSPSSSLRLSRVVPSLAPQLPLQHFFDEDATLLHQSWLSSLIVTSPPTSPSPPPSSASSFMVKPWKTCVSCGALLSGSQRSDDTTLSSYTSPSSGTSSSINSWDNLFSPLYSPPSPTVSERMRIQRFLAADPFADLRATMDRGLRESVTPNVSPRTVLAAAPDCLGSGSGALEEQNRWEEQPDESGTQGGADSDMASIGGVPLLESPWEPRFSSPYGPAGTGLWF